jgi:hypothetical protein
MYLTILGFKYFKIPLSIMAKQNFTPAGVQAKVAELYALPDAICKAKRHPCGQISGLG